MRIYKNLFNQIISPANLFLAWDEFKRDKRKKLDVLIFEHKLEENIFSLHRELTNKTYKHDDYTSFFIQDPKQRHIHKAGVRDRVLHHAIFRILDSVFEPTFINDSYSCRVDKGTHRGVIALNKMLDKVSKNNHLPCFALKCDIKKFFDSVHHGILKNIITKRIKDNDTLWLMDEIIESYITKYSNLFNRRGIPIGNLTSQLFANVYMNEFDQFIKQELKIKNYVRYTDDFVIVSQNPSYLKNLIKVLTLVLEKRLDLKLHPNKIIIRKYSQGVDFLGYVIKPSFKLLRTKTKNRVFRKTKQRTREFNQGKISEDTLNQSLQSYLGVLTHANAYQVSQKLKNQYWFWK